MTQFPDYPAYDEEFHAYGLKCVIKVSLDLGHLCGYIVVPIDHPLFGREREEELDNLEVHGGLTWVGHMPTTDNPNEWCFGFDCCHLFDLVPAFVEHRTKHNILAPGGKSHVFRDNTFVRKESKKLAKQLKEIADGAAQA